MADNGKSVGSSILVSRFGLVSIGNKSTRDGQDHGWETSDSGDSLSYSD